MRSTKNPLRILITPHLRTPYDARMVKGLADGFQRLGQHARALPAPTSSLELAKMCETLSIDVVIQVNRTRDLGTPLPKQVRHVAWFQDVFPQTLDGFSDGFRPDDLLYALGDPGVLGINVRVPCPVGSLLTGVDHGVHEYRPRHGSAHVDFSLCGYIPPPFATHPSIRQDALWYWDNLIRRTPILGRSKLLWLARKVLFRRHLPVNYVPYAALLAMMDIVEGIYRPLHGELDIHELAVAMRRNSDLYEGSFEKLPRRKRRHRKGSSRLSMLLRPYAANYIGRSDLKSLLVRYLASDSPIHLEGLSPFERAIDYFAQTYPRMLDRQTLVAEVLKVSDSLELYGPGWSAHPMFQPYHKGIINDQTALLDVYSRTRINLANNTHGLGIHSRTLECMAVGGFVFTHPSPNDNKPGGMLTAFEPGTHYGLFTPSSIQEEAMRWLRNARERAQVGARAAEIVRAQHLWHHRAAQILDDLSK